MLQTDSVSHTTSCAQRAVRAVGGDGWGGGLGKKLPKESDVFYLYFMSVRSVTSGTFVTVHLGKQNLLYY